jgi:hypothetical protein
MTRMFPLQKTAFGNRRLTDDDVRLVRKLAQDGHTARAIGDYFPTIAIETIRRTIRRETFRDVSDLPDRQMIPQTDLEEQMALLKAASAAHRRLQLDAGSDANALLDEIQTGGTTNDSRNPSSTNAPGEAVPIPLNPLEEGLTP